RLLPLFRRLHVVEAQPAGRLLVELAVQLAAVGAPVVLADETFVPHGVADDAWLLDQDLLLEPVDDMLPGPGLDVGIEHDDAVRMRVAPHHHDLAATLIVGIHDRPRLSRLRPRAAYEAEVRPELLRLLALRLVVLGLGLLKRGPHAQQVVAEPVVRGQELRLLFGRAYELLESVLERRLDALLAVGEVGGPARG